MWRVFCKMLSLDALLEDPRFETNQQRVKHREALIELIESKTTQKTHASLITDLYAIGCPF